MPRFFVFATLTALSVGAATASALLAQTAPAGACELPDGTWCWPLTPATFGDDCQCPTPDGLKWGTIR